MLCPHRGAEMRVLAVIEEAAVIARILRTWGSGTMQIRMPRSRGSAFKGKSSSPQRAVRMTAVGRKVTKRRSLPADPERSCAEPGGGIMAPFSRAPFS